jgi:flagellar biosynthesis protein FlhG
MDNEITIDKLLIDGPKGVKIFPASSGDMTIMNRQREYQQALIQSYMDLRKDFDYILIDTGAGISDYTVEFVLSADKIIVVTTPEPTAITDAYAMIKVLFFRAKHPNISLSINMAQTEDEAKNIFNKINLIVQHFLNKTISSMGYIPLDKTIQECVKEQVPFLIKRPRCAASIGVINIAIALLKEDNNE